MVNVFYGRRIRMTSKYCYRCTQNCTVLFLKLVLFLNKTKYNYLHISWVNSRSKTETNDSERDFIIVYAIL